MRADNFGLTAGPESTETGIDDGFSFCPAFLPPKTNLTEGVQDFRGYASFAAF
jgi:hypothetical protein